MIFGTSKVTSKTLFALFDISLLWPEVSTGSTTAMSTAADRLLLGREPGRPRPVSGWQPLAADGMEREARKLFCQAATCRSPL